MKVRRFEAGDAQPIARLNDRLRAAGITEVVFPEGIEQQRSVEVQERLFVAEDQGEIRGGVWLKEHAFRAAGQDLRCGWLKYPVAESLIDARFNSVPASLIVQCLRVQPRLLALGLGGHETPLARMLKALRWQAATVPMFVRVVRPARVLRQVVPLRRSTGRRVAADLLAMSGLGWLGVKMFEGLARLRRRRKTKGYSSETIERIDSWADDIWASARDAYTFLGARNAATVEALIPASSDLHRIRVRRNGADVGWAVVVCHDFSTGQPDPNFGRLTVGMIADGFALPEHATGVMHRAFHELVDRGADIVVSNQLHPAWCDALTRLGFVQGPSTFAFYTSPGASAIAKDLAHCHINRGDCDGPLWFKGP